MDLSRLKAIEEQKAKDAKENIQRQEDAINFIQLQETVVKSFSALVDYLDGKVSKTVVVNQLKEIATPDIDNVVKALDSLHATLKTHKNTDLSEITSVMKEVLSEAKKIPKDHVKIPEVKIPDNSEQFKALTDAVKAVEESVKAQELIAEAPVVNVDPPDLTKLEKAFKDAVNAIKIPESHKSYSDTVELNDGSVPVIDMGRLITETFDEWRLVRDDFYEDKRVVGIKYLNKNKIVAELKFKLDGTTIIGAKKVNIK